MTLSPRCRFAFAALVRAIATVTILCALALLTSCVEIATHYELNADGTGRVTLVQSIPRNGVPEDTARKFGKEILGAMLASQTGVDAWSQAELELTDAAVTVRATGLFPDVTKLGQRTDLDSLAYSAAALKMDTNPAEGTVKVTLPSAWETVIAPSQKPSAYMSEGERWTEVLVIKEQLPASWSKVRPDYEGFSSTVSIQMAGELSQTVNLNGTSAHEATLKTTVTELDALMKRMKNDDLFAELYARAQMDLLSGAELAALAKAVNGVLYGRASENYAVFNTDPNSSGSPLFDYPATLKAAQDSPDPLVSEVLDMLPEGVKEKLNGEAQP